MERIQLRPQTSMKRMSQYKCWESLHTKIQHLLNVHKTQGNMNNIFPFDLAYILNNQWNDSELKSYQVNCYPDDFTNKESIDKMIQINIAIIQNERKKIHKRLQYLLDIHKNSKDPFPLDLAYMLNLDSFHMNLSFEFDKKYDYNRKLSEYYYTGRVYAISFLLTKKEKSFSQFRFFDLEDYIFDESEVNIHYLKIYIDQNNIPDEPPEDYLLWKSACYDINYNYNRSHLNDFYNPDKYLPDEEIVEPKEYNNIYDDQEPDYDSFNHFDQTHSAIGTLGMAPVAFDNADVDIAWELVK
jgi:hypothetical protein